MNKEDKESEMRALIALTALGDRQAFYKLYSMTNAYLNGVALAMVRNQDASNDILQDAFVQIWHNASSYQPELSKPLTWLTSIIRYRALDRIAKDKRYQQTFIQDEDAEPHCDNGPWRNLLKNENAKQLALCINGLSETQAASVKLAYLKGFSREEIATQLKTKVNTVKSWLHRAQENLRKCLMQY